jgi:anti-sigma factor RsiW
MSSCATIDPLVTPYVDGELGAADIALVDHHLRVCSHCRSRVAAEHAVRQLLHERKPGVCAEHAPAMLRSRCAWMASRSLHPAVDGMPAEKGTSPRGAAARRAGWRDRFAPLATAAILTIVVGGAFFYQATKSSSRVLAAELAADHMKCFTMNALLGTHQSDETVQSSMASGFGWSMRLPADARREGLELVGSRPCLYGEGKIAHIMYRQGDRPVSLFMLPNTSRTEELVEVLGHEAAIWCVGNRTFVLLARASKPEVERLAALVRTDLR